MALIQSYYSEFLAMTEDNAEVVIKYKSVKFAGIPIYYKEIASRNLRTISEYKGQERAIIGFKQQEIKNDDNKSKKNKSKRKSSNSEQKWRLV